MNYILRVLCATIAGLCAVNATPVDTETTLFSNGSSKFAAEFYNVVAVGAPGKNFVFSPFSIRTSAAMLYTGAAGSTAEEMSKGLQLSTNDRDEAADIFQASLEALKEEQLEIANKIYIATGRKIEPEFHRIVTEKFYSAEESIDFNDKENAKTTINNWVKNVTHDKITEIVKSDTFNNSTLLMLLNAIYFKGAWVHPFPPSFKGKFTTIDKKVKDIEVMSVLKHFKVTNLPELDADVLQMDYENSSISMLILLPKSDDGLPALEQKLPSANFLDISAKLKDTTSKIVDVRIPKFKIEYMIDLREPFESIGLGRMFTDDADFSNMISTPRVKVGKALHKTFIDVNEQGTEAAAVTVYDIRPRTIWPRFSALHPFIFAIKSNTAVLFLGRFLG